MSVMKDVCLNIIVSEKVLSCTVTHSK